MKRVLLAAVIVCVLPASRFIAAPQAQADRELERVRALIADGRYGEAVRSARELSESIGLSQGSSSLAFAQSLDVVTAALTRDGKGGQPQTLEIAERAVRLKEQLIGEETDLSESLRHLGDVRAERGEFNAALSLYERSLAIRERQLAADDPRVADAFDRKAFALTQLQRFQDSRQTLVRAERIREARAAQEPLALAGTLELIAWLNRYSGDYAAAAAPLERALSIRRALTPGHPDLISATEVKGDLQYLQGHVSEARDTWTDAWNLGERTLGPDHPTLATLQRRLALVSRAFGDFVETRRLLEQALQVAERSVAPCNPELSALLEDLAGSLQYEGDYVRARNLHARALTIAVRCFGPAHARSATIVHNMAELAVDVGDLDEARRLHERAIQMWSTGLRPDHPFVARGLDALAEVYVASGNLDRARILYQRALTIRKKSADGDGPDVAWTLTNLAQLSFKGAQPQTALKYVDNAISIYGRSGTSDDPDHLARALALQVRIQASSGNFDSARSAATRALATREAIFGRSHPLVAESRADLAAVDFAMGAPDDALGEALAAERIGRDHLRFTVQYLPERQAMAYAAKRPKGLDLALSVIATGRIADSSSVLESVIQSRGVILDELAARTRSTATVDPRLTSLSEALVNARQRFANLMLRSLQGEESVPRALLDEARQQKEDAERAIAEGSAGARADLARARAGLDEVRAALPPDSALVSFARYDRTVISGTGSQTRVRTVPSYIAFVIRSGSTAVHAVSLGPAAIIDAAVQAWRDQAAGRSVGLDGAAPEAEVAYRAAGVTLRRRVWDPVATHLGDTLHVFIAPDGAISLFSFATLPIGAKAYLVEQSRTIHYVSTERDLIPIAGATSAAGLLAVGGAAFDIRRPPTASQPASAAAVRRSSCVSLKSAHFDDLPGSREEVADIARVWRSSGADQSTLLTERAATEAAVKRAVTDRRVIHFATHGFFLGSDCDAAPSGTRAVGGLAVPHPHVPEQSANPLLLSGLALAGANDHVAATSSEDDGILTAEEVAALNLQKTDWVVLSACDTGIGEVRPGEGVFGLRRAFQIAGARTVIMSLWSIDDQAARQWMRQLYQDHFGKHLSTADSMREASLSVLRARRARGESTHPFYWGAFVAAGDWH